MNKFTTLQNLITLKEQLKYRVKVAIQHEDDIEESLTKELLELCNKKIDYIINYKKEEDYTDEID